MSQMAKDARRAMRAKAARLTTNDPHKKVDASSWKPNEALNADKKTGARPIRPRIYKHGGKIQGDRAPRNPGKACRGGAMANGGRTPRGGYADGGTVGTGPLSMANVPAENERQFGSYHVGGYKRGGAPKAGASMADIKTDVHKHEKHLHAGKPLTKLATGGKAVTVKGPAMTAAYKARQNANREDQERSAQYTEAPYKLTDKQRQIAASVKAATRDDSDLKTLREGRKSGGRTKGKTNINIVIAQPRGQQAQQMPPQGPVRPPMPPPQMPPPAAPPMGPPPGAAGPGPMMGPPPGAGGPPMMRARGGRTKGDAMTLKHAGAGSGAGRLEHTALQKRSNRAEGGRSSKNDSDDVPGKPWLTKNKMVPTGRTVPGRPWREEMRPVKDRD